MKRKFFVLIFTVIVVSLSSQSYEKYGIAKASIASLKPLEIGSKAPSFVGKDQFGNEVSLSKLNEEGPVLIVFYRGYWCGICQKQLSEFQNEMSTFLSAGVQVIAIAPEAEQYTKKTAENSGIEFPVVSDSKNVIMDKYNVTFKANQDYQDRVHNYLGESLNAINNQTDATLPIPATYLIDKNGKITTSVQNKIKRHGGFPYT